MQKLLKDSRVQLVTTHMCQYGVPWKKPTSFLVWNVGLFEMKKCCGLKGRCSLTGKQHISLTGANKSGFITRHAQAYPRPLAKDLMKRIIS